ncbi:efflux RND transporter periplasmic adaptor subunit [Ottowia sp.]|uniref:efflux RND transporter periplasmic adaptor subunit n=1 Tax=Ottowia sp. TaxID=1898956 RepID=UPI002BAF54A6|nr:efflux RND transporter periplasmic adaptor subunit [Ottowia sp.]HOB66097.1 efflux RND transporter periplasmic adaptor subunit [Ottowia sp.]HPZ58487.1 efflux RND transporter periplasmic adaptor subunit [Ottowia sp.]HQD48040.1 efflux RND transporter periplasmic adaptor subunit [Ottowia sp.]
MPDRRSARPFLITRAPLLSASVLLAVTLAACGDKQPSAAPGGGGGGGAPPPPEVAVVTVQPGTVGLTTELPGRLEPSRVAQVRARATGILNKRVFTEGSDVRAGQVLYQIDSAPYQATRQSAQAQLAQTQAQLANASAMVTRYRPLVAANAVSKQEFDAAVAAEKAAQAQVAAARAAVRTADINLGYATVTAPISGRIGRSLVTEGALVSAQEGTQLATIQQINPLYLNITQSAAEVMALRQALQSGKLARAGGAEAAKVQVLLENGQVYGQTARLLFTDLSVDPATGQVNLRAEVPNPGGLLMPGMYVRARVEQAEVDNAILLPQQAVTRGTKGDTVMVVAPDGAVAPRPIKIGGQKGNQWIVTEGLKPGEQVMVEGAMKLMMGAKVVKPVPWVPNQAPAPASQAPAAPKTAASGATPGASAPAAPASAASR